MKGAVCRVAVTYDDERVEADGNVVGGVILPLVGTVALDGRGGEVNLDLDVGHDGHENIDRHLSGDKGVYKNAISILMTMKDR